MNDIYARMDPTGQNYIRTRFTHEKVMRSRVVNGTVVDEHDVTAEYVKVGSQWIEREPREPEYLYLAPNESPSPTTE